MNVYIMKNYQLKRMLTQELALSLLSQSDLDKYAYCLHVFIHLRITRFLAVDTTAYSNPVDTIAYSNLNNIE